MHNHQLLFWILFNLFVLAMLAVDLRLFHRQARTIRFREALITACVWVALAGVFAVGVYFWMGRATVLEFITGYLVEEALSVDNLFVFLLIFRYFQVPDRYQHKVLFSGIVGALVMRGMFIWAGVTLIRRVHWFTYVMGAFLVYVGIRMALHGETGVHPQQNPVLRVARRFLPLTEHYFAGNFFVRRAGLDRVHRLYATPLLLVLLVVESTDLVFAVDSVPAVLGITHNPFIVYTSNVFAVLGLRSLYFALAGMIDIFSYLPYGLSLVLAFIGAKMLVSPYYKISTEAALSVVITVLAISVLLSLVLPPRAQRKSGDR